MRFLGSGLSLKAGRSLIPCHPRIVSIFIYLSEMLRFGAGVTVGFRWGVLRFTKNSFRGGSLRYCYHPHPLTLPSVPSASSRPLGLTSIPTLPPALPPSSPNPSSSSQPCSAASGPLHRERERELHIHICTYIRVDGTLVSQWSINKILISVCI